MSGYYPDCLTKFADALGITMPITKIVVEVTIDDVAKVYVKGLLEEKRVESVAGVMRLIPVDAVEVADDCTVVAVRSDA